eukprot:TRINITY_DN52170_c0_g1_i1.p1 TRINITY_DN52170_c0_g1~~TRINITY_DN52170_c0_g1_i1.p1  ORF type:complete len:211 (+),score=19.15 TRINITY_DN52170_c0_g1_i1:64-696(+)
MQLIIFGWLTSSSRLLQVPALEVRQARTVKTLAPLPVDAYTVTGSVVADKDPPDLPSRRYSSRSFHQTDSEGAISDAGTILVRCVQSLLILFLLMAMYAIRRPPHGQKILRKLREVRGRHSENNQVHRSRGKCDSLFDKALETSKSEGPDPAVLRGLVEGYVGVISPGMRMILDVVFVPGAKSTIDKEKLFEVVKLLTHMKESHDPPRNA